MLAMSIMPHQLETVQLLVDRGCPLEPVTTRAVRYGHVDFKSEWSALMVGCERGALGAVRWFAVRRTSPLVLPTACWRAPRCSHEQALPFGRATRDVAIADVRSSRSGTHGCE